VLAAGLADVEELTVVVREGTRIVAVFVGGSVEARAATK
jgi:hypothetical protein